MTDEVAVVDVQEEGGGEEVEQYQPISTGLADVLARGKQEHDKGEDDKVKPKNVERKEQRQSDEIDEEYRRKYGVPPHFRTHDQLHKALRTMERELPRRTNELNTLKSELEQIRSTLSELKETLAKDDIPEETFAAIAEKAAAGDQKGMAAELKKLVKEVMELTAKRAGSRTAVEERRRDDGAERETRAVSPDVERIAIAERELMLKHGYVGEREKEYYDVVVPGMYQEYQRLCREAGVDAIPITVEALYDLWRVRTQANDDEQTKRARREAAATVTGVHRAPGDDTDDAVKKMQSARSVAELDDIARRLKIV